MYLGVLPMSPWQNQRIWTDSPEFTEHSMNPALYAQLAQDCDSAGLDFLFLPDKHVVNSTPPDPAMADSWFEPVTLMSYLAAITHRIGLIPTMSTTWYEPFPLARQILSLDHLSGGRAGWNAVSSHPGLEQSNFGHRPELSRQEMKDRHAEAVSLVKSLWESWNEDALLRDRVNARWSRTGSVRPVDHHGQYFDVYGPLPLSRSPQGTPVVVMAGASESFLRTAARDADVVFTALNDDAAASAMASSLKEFAAMEGRTGASAPLLMPGFFYSASGFPEYQTDDLSRVPGMHYHAPTSSGADLGAGGTGGTGGTERAQRAAGTAVAQEMVRITEATGVDGFIMMPRQIPEDIRFLCTEVVPELVRLGARIEPGAQDHVDDADCSAIPRSPHAPTAAPTLRRNLGRQVALDSLK